MNITKYIFYIIVTLYISYIFYDQIFLPFISIEIPLNSVQFFNKSNISVNEIIIYPDNAYFLVDNIVDNINQSKILNIVYNDLNNLMYNINKYTNYTDTYVPIYIKNESTFSIWTLLMIYLFYNLIISTISISSSLLDKKKNNIAKDVKTKFKDVAGCNEIKNEALEFVDLIKNYNKYKSLGTRVPRGAIFIGPPGTGKTLLAKAIAGECGLPFIHVSGSEFNEVFVGLGSARIKGLFESAKEHKPCIIFIDEIDALAQKRANSKFGRDDRDNTLNALLVEMDGFKSNEGIIVLAATNRPDVLDPAILRPGRFDRKIYFSIPDKNNRKEIFDYYFDKIKFDPNEDKEKTIDELLSMSFGFSGADISNICNEACIFAGKNDNSFVTKQHIRDAFDYVTIGSEKKNYYLTKNEKKTIAYHEIGHAFLAYVLKNASNPIKVSMIPRGRGALGYTLQENPEKKLNTRLELFSRIGVMCGGRIAEEVFIGDISTGASDDFKKASELAKSIYSVYSMIDDKNKLYIDNEQLSETSDRTKHSIEKTSNEIILSIYNACKKMIITNKKIIEDLTEKLKVNEYLTLEDINNYFPKRLHNKYYLDTEYLSTTNIISKLIS